MAKITIEIDTTVESVESVLHTLLNGEQHVTTFVPEVPTAMPEAAEPPPLVVPGPPQVETADDEDDLPPDVKEFIKQGEDDEDDDGPKPGEIVLDSSGLPWDERIHAKSRAINADGTFKKRRGVSKKEFETIAAELRSAPPPSMSAALTPPPPPAGESNEPTWTFPKLLAKVTDAIKAKQVDSAKYAEALEAVGINPIDGIAMLSPHTDKFDEFAELLGLEP